MAVANIVGGDVWVADLLKRVGTTRIVLLLLLLLSLLILRLANINYMLILILVVVAVAVDAVWLLSWLKPCFLL